MKKVCHHSGAQSGATRYVRAEHRLRLVLVCDQCGAERQEIGVVEYRPEPALECGSESTSADHVRASTSP
jgi:hypothetical protein